jgi:5'-nucleotidase
VQYRDWTFLNINQEESMFRKFLSIALLMLLALPVVAQDETFALTIMHTNDVHGWHEPNADGNGGAARQAAVVKQIRAEAENNLLLDGGDRFTGTLFHLQWQGQDSAQIMNMIGYDAMTLGNHEFDNGDDVLAAFIDALEFPVVTANVDFSFWLARSSLTRFWKSVANRLASLVWSRRRPKSCRRPARNWSSNRIWQP